MISYTIKIDGRKVHKTAENEASFLNELKKIRINSIDDVYKHYYDEIESGDFRITKELYRLLNNEFEERNLSFQNKKTSVFLSHGHKDIIYVYCIAQYLKNKHNVNVYIDSFDFSMPPLTNIETAQRLKDKIRKSDRFIFVGTENSFKSKWCNWELGLGDIKNSLGHLAFFVLNNMDPKRGNFNDNEYVGLYPFVFDEGKNQRGDDCLYVGYHGCANNSRIPLKEWLRNSKFYLSHGNGLKREINRKKTIVAFYFSKFKDEAKNALGYRTLSEAFSDIAFRIGGANNTYMLWRRHEFNILFENEQNVFNNHRLSRNIINCYNEWNGLSFEEFTREVLRMIGKL